MSKCVLCGSDFDIECEECDYMALNDYATSVERELYELRHKIQSGEIPSDLVKYRAPETACESRFFGPGVGSVFAT